MILVVDDDADVRRVLREALAPLEGVLEAADGFAALRAVRTRRPSVMLLDLLLPGMRGVDVLTAARRIDPGLAVVVLTGDADLDQARRCLERGARVWISKPFDAALLLAEVRRLLEPGTRPGDPPWRVVRGAFT